MAQFPEKNERGTPRDKTPHLIANNYAIQKRPVVQPWLDKHPRFNTHFTPTSASWLKMVERFTRNIATEQLRRGVFTNVPELEAAINEYVNVGDTVLLRQGPISRTIMVVDISAQRGPAPVAQQLYTETPASIAAREHAAEQRRLAREPAQSIEHGRPTKRDRRSIEKAWDDRWSASID